MNCPHGIAHGKSCKKCVLIVKRHTPKSYRLAIALAKRLKPLPAERRMVGELCATMAGELHDYYSAHERDIIGRFSSLLDSLGLSTDPRLRSAPIDSKPKKSTRTKPRT